MRKIQKTNSRGFTIIEVLIVLAIAGLIIAIVLFAVPALQRNGRNTAIKSDANQIIGYVSDFTANNDGAPPTSVTIASGTVTVHSTAAGTSDTTGSIQKGTTQNTTVSGAQTTALAPAVGSVTINTGAKCDTANPGRSVTSTRSVAVFYSIETSGSATAVKCVSS